MSDGTKASNPKEAFGDAKMPLDLLPDTAVVQFNLAFLEGALKYGQYNWRVAGVKSSTYVRAMRRHLSKWWNGQSADPATMVHELASVGACCAIVLDAIACGKLTDDRPPRADMEKALADAAVIAAHLKQLFAKHTPVQYTQQWVNEQVNKDAATIAEALPPGTLRELGESILASRNAREVPAGTEHRDILKRLESSGEIRDLIDNTTEHGLAVWDNMRGGDWDQNEIAAERVVWLVNNVLRKHQRCKHTNHAFKDMPSHGRCTKDKGHRGPHMIKVSNR
jgi:hypothetical protein